jgi:hypothetical protein
MDLIQHLVALFINLSIGCNALPAEAVTLNGQAFQIQSWSCVDKHHELHVWRTWQRECTAQNGATFWGRPYALEDPLNYFTWYVTQFGELGGGQGATIEQAYVPLCGS